MVVTRNGIAFAGQVAVTDIAAFTLPDDDFTVQTGSANGSNVFARMGAMAIGVGSGGLGGTATDPAVTDTGLESEITSGGGQRRSGNDVQTWLSFNPGANGRQKPVCHWSTNWTFTADFDVTEVMVANHASANQGFPVSRQKFAAPFPVVATDQLRLDVTVEHDGSFVAGGGGTKGGVITNDGLIELARLMMDESTDRIGQDSDPPTVINAGDWISDYGFGNPTKFDIIALEADGTANTTTMSALVSEVAANGGSRKSSGDCVGQLMRDPELFTTDLFNNFEGDTVQWRPAQPGFVFTGAQSVFGQAVLNGNGTKDVLLIRQIYAAALPFDNGDEFMPVVRMLTQ